MKHYIAVDIGASSGRVVLGNVRGGKAELTELHRFPNGFAERGGSYYWNVDELLKQILTGLSKAKAYGVGECTVGIDTWGVDYVLLDRKGRRIGEAFSYRDRRTEAAAAELEPKIGSAVLYEKTGIQQLDFNTLYQLYAHDKAELGQAERILLIPDYLAYRLTGTAASEVTNASTTQLLNVITGDYDPDLLSLLGLSREQFGQLVEPGTDLGMLNCPEAAAFDLPECRFIAAATHDTASAVIGSPIAGERSAYLSSGTWSLLGVELQAPLNTAEAMAANYTNERGIGGSIRFLKNIMGMWLIQEARRLDGAKHSFAELAELAAAERPFHSLISCNDDRFINPPDMIAEIRSACAEQNEPVPETIGAVARCIFDSLALSYRTYLEELERLTGRSIDTLHIVGGGANNALLCSLTAAVTGRKVTAGPTESTALGNLAVQWMAGGEVENVQQARELIADSFDIITYDPVSVPQLDGALARWSRLTGRPGAATT